MLQQSTFKSLHDELIHEELDQDIDHDMDVYQVYEADDFDGQDDARSNTS